MFKDIKSQLSWLLTGAVSQAIVQLLITMILARLISPAGFGVISAIFFLLAFARIFIEAGVGQSIVRLEHIDKKVIGTAYCLSFILALIISTFYFLLNNVISQWFQVEELLNIRLFVILIIFLSVINSISYGLLQRELRFKAISLINIVSYTFGYGLVSIVFAINEYGYISIVYGQISQLIIQFFLYSYLTKNKFSIILSLEHIKYFIQFGGWFTFARLVSFISTQGDNAIVSNQLGTESLGFYGRAYQIIMMPTNLLGSVFEKIAYPNLSKIDDKGECVEIISKTTDLMLFIAIPLSLLLFYNSSILVFVILGEQWGEVSSPLAILSIVLFFRLGYKLFDSYTKAKGLLKQRAYRGSIYALLVIITSYLGANLYGINGVAYGVVISTLIYYFLMLSLICNDSGFPLKKFMVRKVSWGMYLALGILLNFILDLSPVWWSDASILIECFFKQISVVVLMYIFIPYLRNKSIENGFYKIFR